MAIIGRGGMYRHLLAEGCPETANLIAIGDPSDRRKEALANPDVEWSGFVSARASVYTRKFKRGFQIMAGAVVHGQIGEHCIIGNNAVVSHDCVIGDFVTVGPGALILGGARVQDGAFIGAGAVVIPEAVVLKGQLVKAGTVWTTK